MSAAVIGVDPVRKALGDNDQAERLRAIQTQLQGVAEDTRKISHELHPATLEILGLGPALEALADDIEAVHDVDIDITVTGPNQRGVPADASLAFYRITQEALANIQKHAKARHVTITLVAGDDRIDLRVADDGVGFDESRVGPGLGLSSIRERARLMNGTLRITSTPGSGTEVVVELPLETGGG